MATKVHYVHDTNMNSLTSNTGYVMNPYQLTSSQARSAGSPNRKANNTNRNGPGQPNKATNLNYRESTQKERSTTTPPPRPAFEDFDEPPSPPGSTGYCDDRVQNDLLDEICSDIGINDATELDIFDFDADTDQYIIGATATGQTHLPDDLECLDETVTFGDIQPEHYATFDVPGPAPRCAERQYFSEGGGEAPIDQRPVSDEVKSAGRELSNSDCLASPTVSSTCPGSQSGKHIPRRPASQGSGIGSPAIHSTSTSSAGAIADDIKELKKELQSSIKLLNSPVHSPALSCTSRGGPPSVEGPGKFMAKNERNDVSSTTPGPTEDATSSCMLSSSPDRKPAYTKPNSHQGAGYPPCQVSASTSCSTAGPKLSQYCGQNTTGSEPSPHDLGHDSSRDGVGTGSHYGGNQQSLDAMAKEKVYRFLDSQHQVQVNKPVITGAGDGQSTTSGSPPQHAAKRARIISSGNELLEEMRNRYAFTKGADMYVPNKHPNIDGSYTPTPVVPSAIGQQTQLQRTDAFPNQPGINFAEAPCMKPENQPRFTSCAKETAGPSTAHHQTGTSQNQPGTSKHHPGANPYCSGVLPNQALQYDQSMSHYGGACSQTESSQYGMNAANQGSMYGSCPNLSPQDGSYPAGRAFSPMPHRPPVAQPRMSHGYNHGSQGAAGAYYGQTYQNPVTSPIPGDSQSGMYHNRSMSYGPASQQPSMANNMNQSMSAPSTPMKQMPANVGEGPGHCYDQETWNANNNNNGNQYGVTQGHPNMYRSQQDQGQGNMPGLQDQSMRRQQHPNQQGMPVSGAMAAPLRPCSPSLGAYHHNQPMSGAPASLPVPGMPNCRMISPGNITAQNPTGSMSDPNMSMQNPNMMMHNPSAPIQNTPGPMHNPNPGTAMHHPNAPMQHAPGPTIHVIPKTVDTQTPVSQQGFMQSIIADRSSAFRSHPLFPLLRDLIIADMNFHTPSFPFQLIANLPADFDRLLQNYLQRNPPANNYQGSPAVEGVIMDALKYAHSALIGKIQARKQKEGYDEPAKPISAIEDFCERFDRAVKNSMVKTEYEGCSQDPFMSANNPGNMGPPTHPAPGHPVAPPGEGMIGTGDPNHAMMSQPPGMSQHPGMNGMQSQSYQDLTRMGPGPSPYPQSPMVHPHLSGYHERRANSLPSTPRKVVHGRLHDTSSETTLNRTGSEKSVSSGTGTGKSKVLPKESVALMMDWLRKHQDNPYPNDDEKEMLIQKTKLTINQINYWFTNARRRILPKWALQRYMEQQEKQKQIDQQQQQIGTQSAVH